MKKILITLAGLFAAAIISFAETVDRDQARTIAFRWLGAEVTESEYVSDAFYIFNGKDGGWIMISAEDAAVPVLAYSDKGSFKTESIPLNLKNWLGGYENEILTARRQKQRASTEVTALWKTAGYRTKAAGQKVLETPNWGQDSPFNDQCPKVTENGRTNRAVTGCVATAIAEVIRYHQWPAHGTGTIGGYTYRSDYNVNVTIDSYSIDTHNYDYSLMPMEYKGSENSAQKTAVAQLMHDCGVMVEAMYNYNTGTGAYSENIANALFNHMSYAPTAQLLYRSAYTDAEWTRIVEKEIDSNRPIIYSGNDAKDGGHQFVCDGYDTRDYIRINWGWDGEDNGFFTLSLKIPGKYTFSYGQSMVIGVEPNKSGSTTRNGGPLIYDLSSETSQGLSLKSGSIMSKNFTLKADAIFNTEYYVAYSGAVRAGLIDWKGNLKEFVCPESSLELGGYNLVKLDDIQCTITGDVTFGDRVVLFYKTVSGQWDMIRGKEAYDNNDKTYYLSSSIPAVDAAFILIPENLKAGDTLFFELIPGSSPIKTVSWYYDGDKQSGITANLTAGTHTLRAEVTFKNGSQETLTAKLLVK